MCEAGLFGIVSDFRCVFCTFGMWDSVCGHHVRVYNVLLICAFAECNKNPRTIHEQIETKMSQPLKKVDIEIFLMYHACNLILSLM